MQAALTPACAAYGLSHRARGFTLIELMVVLAIGAILLAIGTPMLAEFVADQRVRTVTSDIVADFAYARVQAIERSKRITVKKTGAAWREGWTIFEDTDNDGAIGGADTVLKIVNGIPPGNLYLCTDVAEFATAIVFRPDGRVVRTNAAVASNGLYVIDTLGDAVVTNNKIRGILFGTSGRATINKLNGTLPPIPCNP